MNQLLFFSMKFDRICLRIILKYLILFLRKLKEHIKWLLKLNTETYYDWENNCLQPIKNRVTLIGFENLCIIKGNNFKELKVNINNSIWLNDRVACVIIF